MKQVTGLANVAGTSTTSNALSRGQGPRAGVTASEQTKIRAVSIMSLPSAIDGRILLICWALRRSKTWQSTKQKLGQFEPRIIAAYSLIRLRGCGSRAEWGPCDAGIRSVGINCVNLD